MDDASESSGNDTSDYVVMANRADWRVRVEFNGVSVADSSQAVLS